MQTDTVNWGILPTVGDYDVVVCGAGPAGLGAALAAGRAGARTLLVERQFCVGGMASCTGINTWCDTPGGAIFDELFGRLEGLGKARWHWNPEGHLHPPGRAVLHGETLKAVAVQMLQEAGVDLLLGGTAAGARVEGSTVSAVLLATKGGLCLAPARVVIDCTADADVAALAGAEFSVGDPRDGRIMHVNFMFQLGGIDRDAYEAARPSPRQMLDWIMEARRRGELHAPKGVFHPAPDTFPYNSSEDTLALNYWEIEGVDCSDPLQVSATLTDCYCRALEVVRFCREHLPGHERCALTRFWEVLGTRESRRLKGRATVTGDDLLAGRTFPDGIASACFFIDFHDSPPGRTIPYDLDFKVRNSPPAGEYYEIRYGCLLPSNRGGLLVAGRCISADRPALASLRVMPTCMYLGQAAGTAAAMAVERAIAPEDVPGEDVKARVMG